MTGRSVDKRAGHAYICQPVWEPQSSDAQHDLNRKQGECRPKHQPRWNARRWNDRRNSEDEQHDGDPLVAQRI